MKDITTIKVKKSTVRLINKIKLHPRQSCEEVILELIQASKKNEK